MNGSSFLLLASIPVLGKHMIKNFLKITKLYKKTPNIIKIFT